MHLAFMGRWVELPLIVGGQRRSGCGRAAPGGAGHSSLGRGWEGSAESPKEGGEAGREGGGEEGGGGGGGGGGKGGGGGGEGGGGGGGGRERERKRDKRREIKIERDVAQKQEKVVVWGENE